VSGGRIDKLLVANRGEIACRVIATARRLGIETVAVFSDADRQARHVALADEAAHIGPAPAAESYLRGERIRAAARATGAGAVHPGYGFLAENADFAAACAADGLIFVGPGAEAIRAMGSKSAAKALMAEAGVPLLPGYHGHDQDDATLEREARAMGFPLLIKPVAGGGGKGMRVVRAAGELGEAVAAARREAEAAFGDPGLLLERYLERPRHVEVQVFCDTRGNGLHLHERDCSIQRRHQKVVEEAPAPGLDPALRAALGEAAVRAALAIEYRGAGTVEFLLDGDGRFYFMEMNTRLQVEHPVTEMVTGLDLVEWQLRVAAGEPLPLAQAAIPLRGHAVEMRLYAEDPERGFLPATGRIAHLRFPAAAAHTRVDTGVESGDTVSVHYDPMIAKLVCWGEQREQALRRAAQALAATEIIGPRTNRAFLHAIVTHPQFRAGEVDTGFIDRHGDGLLAQAGAALPEAPAIAALWLAATRAEAAAAAHGPSPWTRLPAWRLNLPACERLDLSTTQGETVAITVAREAGVLRAALPGEARSLALVAIDGARIRFADGERLAEARVLADGDHLHVFRAAAQAALEVQDPRHHRRSAEAGAGSLLSPMPGRILEVMVSAGDRVERGAPLLVLEAMKMEHTVQAPIAGEVTKVNFAAGDSVPSEGLELLVIAGEQ